MKVQRLKRHAGQEGFSLAELMVVIVIIGLLATVVVPNVVQKLFVAKKGAAKASLTTLYNAAEDYSLQHNGKWPDSLEQLVTPDENGQRYLRQTEVPMDPWGNPFLYEPPRAGESSPVIATYGADGAPGGTGDDEDMDAQGVIDGKYND